jgi:glycosyltransferase involved in cell wall biosynthesis
MNKTQKQEKRKRTIEDRLISWFNSCRYAVTEPIELRVVRARYERLYADSEENPLVSVCVPTYNRGPLLVERAVSSVLSQTYKNFELIIVGDHCTDNTAELLSQIDDPRLRFYNLPRRERHYPPTVENHWFVGGAVPANRALELVHGKWIARVDDDDMWTPDHIETLLRFAQKGQYEFVSAAYIAERHGKRIVVDLKDENPRIGGVQTWLYRSYLSFFRYNIDCWRKSWNRVWDTDLQDRIFRAGVRMGFLDQVVAYVLPRPGETTVGLEAYRLTEQEKLEHYKFSDD